MYKKWDACGQPLSDLLGPLRNSSSNRCNSSTGLSSGVSNIKDPILSGVDGGHHFDMYPHEYGNQGIHTECKNNRSFNRTSCLHP